MVGTYEIEQGGRVVGTVQVQRQGLYYHISCRCKLSGEVIHRLVAVCAERQEDLGICVPMDGKFGVEKRIPCKRLGSGALQFQLMPKQDPIRGKFVPIYPDEPFSYMARLKNAFLENRDGQLGIIIPE